jgi:hypothetical protein
MRSKNPKSFSSIERARAYWKRAMHSTQDKLSRGASKITKIISWARGDNWRRKNPKK